MVAYLDIATTQSTVMLAVKDIRHDAALSLIVMVVGSIAHKRGNAIILGEGTKARDDGDVGESLPGLSLREALFVAVGAGLQVFVWTDITATRVDAAVIRLRLKLGEECHALADSVERW